MLPDTGGLQSYLDGRNTYDCYESFTIGGDEFTTRGTPPVRRGTLRNALGREVATCEFTILCGGGSDLFATALGGTWDGAALTVARVYGTGSVTRFRGYVAEVRCDSTSITIVGKSLIPELNRKVQSREYSTLCPWVYGSEECGGSGNPCDHTIGGCTSAGHFGGFVSIPSN